MPEMKEIIVVCDPFFRDIFEGLVPLYLISFTSYYFWLRDFTEHFWVVVFL